MDSPEKQRNRVQWVKGQSGNPKGRPPKNKCLVNMIEHYLTLTPEQLKTESEKPGLDMAHRIAIKFILDCYAKPHRVDSLMDRLYGAPKQAVDMTTKGKALNGSREIPPSVIDEAMEILNTYRGNPPLPGGNGKDKA